MRVVLQFNMLLKDWTVKLMFKEDMPKFIQLLELKRKFLKNNFQAKVPKDFLQAVFFRKNIYCKKRHKFLIIIQLGEPKFKQTQST